ncbi:LSU ribosomal protein L24p (L26e) [hydrothermal vent metagenome]|uniref:LSU ribosomal protein L24p (L26e) n=1 Tax=hydrothermal vent metagenome TaxID=652676 RepID=A0A3B0VDL3_9ZZZZ
MKIKKNDKVQVIAGKDKGKSGVILRVLPNEGRVVVEGIAIAKRHTKGARGEVGRIVERPQSIHASNVMLIDPETKKPTRIRIEKKDNARVRIAVKSGKKLA